MTAARQPSSARIEDYALIGDCETVALVSHGGSIDWLCWPRFDSSACFAALLGTPEHGRWLIEPVDADAVRVRRYRPNTLILETEIRTSDGVAVVIDFMPLRGNNSDVVRMIRGLRGRVRLRTELVLRFDYGRAVPWVNHLPDGTFRAIAGPDMVVLHTPIALAGRDLRHSAEFDVTEGQTVPFVLTYGASHLPPPAAIDHECALADTETYWTAWAAKSQSCGAWTEAVTRSLITLKALTYAPTGGIVAAATTSLPEQIGGVRNWDYRFCWLRDATLTLLSLMNAGYYDEALAWRDWLLRAAAGAPAQLQIMYGVAGERRLTEVELPWLPGYEQSAPVRIGNGAHGQLQLDVFGEVMDALHQARHAAQSVHATAWDFQRAMIAQLEAVWDQPDEGIWEVRSGPRQFTFSKVMAWVALDRGIRDAEHFGLSAPLDDWRRLRQRIHDDVCSRGFNPAIGSFVQSYGSSDLDASLLLIATLGFLPPDDARVRGTIEAVERGLMVDGLVLRYRTEKTDDGLPPGEGAFLACSFWLADAFVMIGREQDARELFERLLALRNDVGLLAEEYDPRARRLLGNFPQAFSHVGLINTAHNLAREAKPAAQRAAR
jgi:GH15 family glucan-1,4-alpha-glucosidase